MRVLTLGHRLPHRLVDNHNIVNAPNIDDYEAIVLDLHSTFEFIQNAARAEGQYTTFAGAEVVNGDSVDGTVGLAALLQRRREEIVSALDRGATICVFLDAQSRFFGVNGLHSLDRFFLLPAPDGMNWDEQTIRGSEGTAVAVADHGHPFVDVYETYQRLVTYRAVVSPRAPGVAARGKVFLRGFGGDPVGIEFPVLSGRIVFMPAMRESSSTETTIQREAAEMIEAMTSILGRTIEDEPRWASEFSPPGLSENEAAIKDARRVVEQAQAALDQAESDGLALRRIRQAVWASGDGALLPAVMAAAEALGFTATRTPEGEAVLTAGSDVTIQLVAAGSAEAVDMSPHYRLRDRLDRIIAARAIKPRGLIVVNGQRQTHPSERKREYIDAVRVASEAVGYALVTSGQLSKAARAALAGAPEDTLAEVRTRLATTNGVVTFDDLFPEG